MDASLLLAAAESAFRGSEPNSFSKALEYAVESEAISGISGEVSGSLVDEEIGAAWIEAFAAAAASKFATVRHCRDPWLAVHTDAIGTACSCLKFEVVSEEAAAEVRDGSLLSQNWVTRPKVAMRSEHCVDHDVRRYCRSLLERTLDGYRIRFGSSQFLQIRCCE